MIAANDCLLMSGALFALGVAGVILRRNILVQLMSLEMILNAANLALAGFSRAHGNLDGQVMVFFIITVAAAEVAVGLAIVVILFRLKKTAHVHELAGLKL
ncbi:MAG: NADH-quinone oxidoreductase subunit NuoK [Verrucomicrobiae bacterium]|nr:NADH-quinone oxidoreductase subunit NuoK [Verrucomicrobiae bacterium]